VTAADAAVEETPGYWKAEAKKTAEKLKEFREKVKRGEAAEAELKAIRDKDLSESQRLAKENEDLRSKATRAEALEAEVKATFDMEAQGLTEAQLAVVVGETPEARLRHLRALKAAGMLGAGGKQTASPGNELPGDASAVTMKRGAFDKLSARAQSEFVKKGGRIVD
jgi:CRP-like cAMP-binding protein